MENLFEIAGETYYFDLDKISDFIRLDKEEDDVETLLKMPGYFRYFQDPGLPEWIEVQL